MNNKHSNGQNLTLVAPYNVSSGAGLLVGSIFAVAIAAALTGESVAAERTGAFSLAALSTDTASIGDAAYWDDTNKRITTTSTGNTLVGHFYVAKLNAETTATVLLTAPSSAASPDIVTSTVVTISTAELLLLNTTPKDLVAAPGAGLAIVPVDAVLFLDYATTAYDGIASGEDIVLRYTDGSGNIAGTVEATGFLDASADAHRVALFSSLIVPTANAKLVAHMATGNIATGDSPLKIKLRYRVVPLLT